MFLESRREGGKFWTEWYQLLPEFGLLLISSWIKFWFITVVPKYMYYATFSKYLLANFISWFCPAFWWRDSNMYLVFSAFISRPTSLLASIKVPVLFFLWYLCYSPVDSHQHPQYALHEGFSPSHTSAQYFQFARTDRHLRDILLGNRTCSCGHVSLFVRKLVLPNRFTNCNRI
jgi:hypothetical protein